MITALSKRLPHQNLSRIPYGAKRTLFTKPVEGKSIAHLVGLTAILTTTAVINQNKDSKDAKKIFQSYEVFRNHSFSNSGKELLEAAKVLDLYGHYAQEEDFFFRGEKLPQNIIDTMDKNLGIPLELTRNTPITTAYNVAKNFSEAPFLEKLFYYLADMTGVIENKKRISVLYDIKIPKNFKFIKVPTDMITDFHDESCQSLKEFEYVLPEGTLIKITKKPSQETDSKQLCYTIHVLEQ